MCLHGYLINSFSRLSKTVDTICDEFLLDKLDRITVGGVTYNLFKRYLSNRMQQVKIGNVLKTMRFVI